MINLSEKLALVTGSTRGIGRAIALYLARAGAKVIVTGRNEEKAREVAKDISAETSSEVYGIGLDLGSRESIDRAVAQIEEIGQVDILVNNAGINRDTLFIRMKEEDWEEVLRVNLTGTFLITQKLIKPMMKKRWGRVIMLSSVVGFIGNPGQANYSASKAGLVGFAKTIAKELAPRNITVNVVAPGYIETDMTDAIPDDIKDNFKKQIPMGRFGKPEDVAGVVLFLSSDLASYITGEVVHVNGGLF